MHLKIKFNSHKQYLFSFPFSGNAKKTRGGNSMLHAFLLSEKKIVDLKSNFKL